MHTTPVHRNTLGRKFCIDDAMENDNYALKKAILKGMYSSKNNYIMHFLCAFESIFNSNSNNVCWEKLLYLPQIFSGASNSRRIGCDRNISRDFKHKPRISASVSWTFLPGRAPRTGVEDDVDIDIDEFCRCWFTYHFYCVYTRTRVYDTYGSAETR